MCLICRKRKQCLPSIFFQEAKTAKGKGKGKLNVYERDIVCLPHNFVKHGDIIDIPRKKHIRHYLAVNKLVGKIQLNSNMTESDIFNEIRSVFRVPMGYSEYFRFKILQSSGGDSRSLIIPELSPSYTVFFQDHELIQIS